jgi:hypothetical protein
LNGADLMAGGQMDHAISVTQPITQLITQSITQSITKARLYAIYLPHPRC